MCESERRVCVFERERKKERKRERDIDILKKSVTVTKCGRSHCLMRHTLECSLGSLVVVELTQQCSFWLFSALDFFMSQTRTRR